MSVYRKPPKEFTINEQQVLISPLKVGTLLRVKNLSKAVAEAFAKLRSTMINDYEQVKNTKPAPSDSDKDAIEYYEKTTHKAPEISAVSLVLRNRQEGIEALFKCFFENDLLEDILRSSVNVFRDIPKGSLLDPEKEDSLDLPTALDYFIAIIEVNAGSFAELGKFSHLLAKFQGVAEKAKPE